MPEMTPPFEASPSDLEVRRDALLLRIVELREAVKKTSLDQGIVSKELDELDRKVQGIQGSQDMTIFEEIFDALEKTADKARRSEQ